MTNVMYGGSNAVDSDLGHRAPDDPPVRVRLPRYRGSGASETLLEPTDVLSELTTVLSLPTEKRHDQDTDPPRQKQRRLHELEQLELVDAYRAVESVYGIADRFGIARQTVSAVPERHGVARRYRMLTPQDIDAAVRLYESGLSLAAVGERFQVNASTVLNALRTTGVRVRPVGTNQWRR